MGRPYSAGNLSFEFTGNSSGGINAIEKLIEKLNDLKTVTKALDFSNAAGFSSQLNTLLTSAKNADTTALRNIKNISSAFNSLNNALKNMNYEKATEGFNAFLEGLSQAIAPLNEISNTLGALNSISKAVNAIGKMPKVFEKINGINFGNVESAFDRLTKAISPFLDKVERSKDAIIALSNLVNKLGKDVKSKGGGGGKTGGLFGNNGFLKLLTFSGTIYSARRLGNVIANIITKGSDYTETLNKWTVAMSKNVDYAEEFVNKMNKAYGISRETLMNAQSTFKNMIGSLGQISEETAYNLSKGITQMAIDYSSLYNVQLETAFSKFQSVLAGQVRPIRTDSGFDITETTLFQLYQSLGGEKSMRQLTRTEKQLLSILTIFHQMNRSGALGDMEKTIDNFANQSRMLKENVKEFVTWLGISVQYLLQEKNILVGLNALMIVASKVAQQFAKNLGYTDPDFGLGWSENIEDTSLALDELNGKLLGFDKFRALQSSGDNNLAIDKVLENAIKGYASSLASVNNPAQELANDIINGFGGIDDLTEKIENFSKAILNLIGAIALFSVSQKISGLITFFVDFDTAMLSFGGKTTLVIFAIAAIAQVVIMLVKAFKDGEYGTVLLANAIGVVLVGAIILVQKHFSDFKTIGHFLKGNIAPTMLLVSVAVMTVASAVTYFIQSMDKLKEKGNAWIPVLVGITAALVALGVALYLLKGNWVAALSIAGIVGAAGLAAGTYFSITDFEQGGTIPRTDSGTVFRVGENGKTETLYTAPDGSTNVANVQQMKAAFYGALVDYGKTYSGANGETIIYIGEEPVFNAVQRSASKKGLAFAKKG